MEERLTDRATQRGDLGTTDAQRGSWTLGLLNQRLRNAYNGSGC
jgi:hypothetical protein